MSQFIISYLKSLPLEKYCIVAWLIAIAPIFFIAAITYIISLFVKIDVQDLGSSPIMSPTFFDFIGITLFSPIVETFFLSLLAFLISKYIKNNFRIAVIMAIFFAGFHALRHPFWFFGTIWPFFIFSTAYITWRPVSYWKAYIAACTPHILNNLVIFLVVNFF